MLYDNLIAPFADFEFMRRALVGTVALALGAPPIGVFLMLRRMSLIGDAMAHAILPGAAIGFLFAGLSLPAMAGGGIIAGFLIAIGAGLISRTTQLKEDASLAALFVISLALGVTIVALKGNNIDLMHFLFGSVLAIDNGALVLILAIASVSLVVLAVIWRPLVLESVDPGFLRLRRDVHLDQHRLRRVDRSDRLSDAPRVDRLDERKPADDLLHLVRLQVPDQVPLRAVDRVHLGQRLLDPVLAEDLEARGDGLPADLRPEALGDGDDHELVRVAAGLLDSFADRSQVLSYVGDHRKATMAPNRLPSGYRRCEGKR